MHERYAHSAFIFITAYAFYRGRYGPYVLFSIAYLLNLERVLEWFELPSYGTLLFDPRLIAALYAGGMVWTAAQLYQSLRLTRGEQAINPPAVSGSAPG
jgi:hypothetical protein